MDRGSPRGFDLSQREVCCAVICYFEYFLIRLDVLVNLEGRVQVGSEASGYFYTTKSSMKLLLHLFNTEHLTKFFILQIQFSFFSFFFFVKEKCNSKIFYFIVLSFDRQVTDSFLCLLILEQLIRNKYSF